MIRIANVADLCNFAVCVNEGDDCTGKAFKLVDDIDLAGIDFKPIGEKNPLRVTEDHPFNGIFDGDVHTISNLQISSSDDNVGLFGYVGNRGMIKNIRLMAVNISGKDFVGGFVGFNFGKVQCCALTGSTVNGYETVGGLIGNNFGMIRDCRINVTQQKLSD